MYIVLVNEMFTRMLAKGSCKSATHECVFDDAVKTRPRGLWCCDLIPHWPLHLRFQAGLGIWR